MIKNNLRTVSYEKPLKVMLLSLGWYRRKDPRTPLGMAYIYAGLKNHFSEGESIEVFFAESDIRDNISNVIHKILVENPDVLGIGVYAWNSETVKSVLNSLRSLGYIGTIVLGGPEITYGSVELNDEFQHVQYFVKGFGESAFADIVESVRYNKEIISPGVYKRGDVIGNALADPMIDFSSSPFSREELVSRITGDNFIRWQTQRGCVFRCSFCAFKMPNGRVANSDLETVRLELEMINKIGVKNVAVLDPIFFINQERSIKILDLIEEVTPDVNFNIQSRFEHLDSKIIEKISSLKITLECGLQTMDENVQRKIKRLNNREKVIASINSLHAHNVRFETHLIYGLPGQTIKSFLSDMRFLTDMRCNIVRIFPLSRLRGTEIDVESSEKDMIFSPVFPREIIQTRWMNREEVLKLKNAQIILEDRNGKLNKKFMNAVKRELDVI